MLEKLFKSKFKSLIRLFEKNQFMKSFKVIAQKMKFSIKGIFSKCDQIHRKLQIWSLLLKKSLMEKFIFCAVGVSY